MNDYPEGFPDWPLDRRNAFIPEAAKRYREAKEPGAKGRAIHDTENARRWAHPKPDHPLPLAPLMHAARPYPVAALGPVLSNAANSIAARCQCASALAAQSVLAVASLAAQRLADVRLPYGQTRPLSLYFVTVAASGDRKTTADNEALIPVRMHESSLKQDYEHTFPRGASPLRHGRRNTRKSRLTRA